MIELRDVDGPCTITIRDKDGKVIFDAKAFIKSYSLSMRSSPIHVLGSYQVMEYLDWPVEMQLSASIFNTPVIPSKLASPAKRGCNHRWKDYEGFMEKYQYCEICGIKENES